MFLFLKIPLDIQDCFGYSRSFVVPQQILGLFYFCDKCHWNFDRDCIESVDGFG